MTNEYPVAVEATSEPQEPLDVETNGLPALQTVFIEEEPIVKTAITNPIKGDNWNFSPPSEDIQLRIQEVLAAKGIYLGRRNGTWGNLSVYAIGEVVGYPTQAPDRELCARVYEYAIDASIPNATLDSDVWEYFAEKLEGGHE